MYLYLMLLGVGFNGFISRQLWSGGFRRFDETVTATAWSELEVLCRMLSFWLTTQLPLWVKNGVDDLYSTHTLSFTFEFLEAFTCLDTKIAQSCWLYVVDRMHYTYNRQKSDTFCLAWSHLWPIDVKHGVCMCFVPHYFCAEFYLNQLKIGGNSSRKTCFLSKNNTWSQLLAWS